MAVTTREAERKAQEKAQQVLNLLKERLGKHFLGFSQPTANRLYVDLRKESVGDAVKLVFNEIGARYVISVGTDKRPLNGGFEVLHIFAFDKDHLRIGLRFPMEGQQPKIDSITPIVRGAGWAEREFRDLVGIHPIGHPDPRRLVLADDWPEGLHPLRKDFPHDYKPPSDGGAPFQFKEPPEGTTAVVVGPFFPVLEEPSQWRLFVDGENVVGCDYRGFYVHRGIEKLGDSALTYNQIPFIAERICGICGYVHSCTYCQAVEEAVGIQIPRRAAFIRSFILEMERVHSHLLWIGLACHIIGFDTVFMQSWRIREPIMWLAEKITGNRKNYGMNLVGGVRRDIPKEMHDEIRAVLDRIEKESMELASTIEGDTPLVMRLRDVGIFTYEEAWNMGAVGPTARGSGVDIDVRRDHPYAAYDELDFNVVVYDGCDVLARTMVRVGELFESIKIMRQCLERMPDGPIMAEINEELPAWLEGMQAVEAPRGEVFHYLLTGEDNRPYRWKVRAPSYQNIQSVPLIFKEGTTIADVPISLGSFDPCFSCTERMEIVDRSTGKSWFMTEKELMQLSREAKRKG